MSEQHVSSCEAVTQRSARTQSERALASADGAVPGVALLLGASGLLPFAAPAIILWFAPTPWQAWLVATLTAYGAVILSFMGAVHWGLAMVTRHRWRNRWFGLSVVPALVGWCAVMLSPLVGLLVLSAAFACVYALDLAAVRAGIAPPWYLRLRRALTLAVAALLLLAASAVWSAYS